MPQPGQTGKQSQCVLGLSIHLLPNFWTLFLKTKKPILCQLAQVVHGKKMKLSIMGVRKSKVKVIRPKTDLEAFHSFIHSLTHSLTHSFTHSLIQWFHNQKMAKASFSNIFGRVISPVSKLSCCFTFVLQLYKPCHLFSNQSKTAVKAGCPHTVLFK